MVLALAAPPAASAAGSASAPPSSAGGTGALSSAAASARARATGKPVLAAAMTTPTREVTANPNGTFTMTISPSPVRVERHGAWVALDATLHANADGTISPAAVPGALTLSGGGTGALATMTSGGQQLSVTLPAVLPKPTISGASATYANVVPGADLVVTATSQGGFSDVFVVRTHAAATDPRLASLMSAHLKTGAGLSLRTNAAGEMFAAGPDGHAVFTAPAPAAWDSATAATTPAGTPAGAGTGPGALIPTSVHTPLASTALAPGRYAHQASLHASLHNGTLTLTSPGMFAAAPASAYPLYIDPAYGPAIANFATVNSAFPTQSYINGAGTQGYMQVGYNGNLEGCSPCFNARSFVTLNLSGLPAGATNISAQVNFWDTWSASCTAEELDLWTTGPISTSSSNPTTWNHQPSWNSQVGSQTVSKGWSSSCPSGGIGYNISSQVQSVVNAKGSSLTLGLRIPSSQESSNDDNWKQLNGSNTNQSKTTASVTYDVKPNTPSGLYTSPTTNCSSSSPTILGDTGVTLYAPVSTSTGANLTTTFDFYNASAPGTNLLTTANGIASDTYTGASGKPAVMALPESFIKTQAGSATTTFAWKAETSDGTLTSNWSTPCTFKVDNSQPGSPTVAPAASPPAGSTDCPLVPATPTEPVGTSCAFTFTAPIGATISGYTYQVNDSQPIQVSGTGSVTVEFNLPGIINTLTVSALSAAGNVGSARTVWFDATAFNPPETDGDLTGGKIPDLIVPGGTTGAFPPGLWLAQGQRNGAVDSNPINIGTSGLGLNTTSTPSDWNGTQAITGNFCGQGTQDVLAYYPGAYDATTNPNGGGGAIVCGTGTTQPLQVPSSGNQYTITEGSFSYTPDGNTYYNATTVANGGSENDVDAGASLGLMYGIVPTSATTDSLAVFAMTAPNAVGGGIALTSLTTPTGGTDWNNWSITTAQDTRGTTTYTDMYLWDSATGDLYLWAGLGINATSFDKATGISYTQYQIASNWNKGASLTLRAADIAGDGNPGLWATNTATGTTTAYIPPATLAANPTLTTTASTLTTATHSWQFDDMPAGASGTEISTTADGNGSMSLTGSASGADWNAGDRYSPDVRFTGSGGKLQTTGAPIDLTRSFTVDFWTEPERNGTMALSESGSAYPGLMIYPVSASGWEFYLANDNGTASWGGDAITGGNVDFGVWTHIRATYNATTQVMSLYVDDTFVATGSHTPPSSSATGPLTLGANIDNGTYTSWYTGQVANVQTWSNAALTPNQPVTPASYHQPITPERILDTRQSTTNTYSGIVENNTPLGAGTTLTVPIVGDKVTPVITGAPTTIPATATAVAADVTLVSESSNGNLIAYADGTQRPITSSTNYSPSTIITGYQIVPLGQDGKIDLYNSSSGTTHVIIDITGYFTSDSTLAGDQTYHPLTPAYRAVNTGSSDANTNLPSGTTGVTAGEAFTMNVTGVDGIPSTATGVAVNLTTTAETGGGYLEVYATGSAPSADTALSYQTNNIASLSADVPLGTVGTITIVPEVSTTEVIADISGYYTTNTSGQVYHSVNPTRLVDTRSGIGGITGAVSAKGTYPLSGAATQQITTATNPTLALMLTSTQSTASGFAVAYPTGTSQPGTSNLNWNSGQSIANLALTPTGTNGGISIYNNDNGTTQLVIDCSGYFANY
jgi:hypothetical protein